MTFGDNTNYAGKIGRRAFLVTGVSAAAWTLLRYGSSLQAVEARDALPAEVRIVQFGTSGQPEDTLLVPTIVKTDAQWRQLLPHDSYDITRRAGTEYPYSGKYWDLHERGLYRCICCDTALFSSETKFESGTGWPSFWQPVPKENVRESSAISLGVERTAVSCRRCAAHLGHAFDDGPKPTGLRYCMNSVAMKFVKLA